MKNEKTNSKLSTTVKGAAILGGIIAAGATYKVLSSPEHRQKAAVALIRRIFDSYGKLENHRFTKYVPDDVVSYTDIHYDKSDGDAHMDIYYPSGCKTSKLVPIVWVHGGGWIAGDKESKEPWSRILAHYARAVVISVDYSIAPQNTYPLPVRQVNTALKYLNDNATRLGIDRRRFILAGDSAGAQIAAQVALINTNRSYARRMHIKPSVSKYQLAGTILLCGAYDLKLAADDAEMAKIMQVFVKAYTGRLDFSKHPLLKYASIPDYVTKNFPRTFITDGNYDPLLKHSHNLDKALQAAGVETDTLFFPQSYRPRLLHEYQFNLGTEAGRLAFNRILRFIDNVAD